jgi:hypothetical protein
MEEPTMTFAISPRIGTLAAGLALAVQMVTPSFAQQNTLPAHGDAEGTKKPVAVTSIDKGDLAGRVSAMSTSTLRSYVSGSGPNFMALDLSRTGNIRRFECPQGWNHLTGREGYALSWGNASVAYDAGTRESGFGEPSIEEPNGPGNLPLILYRTTTNGWFTVWQYITRDPDRHEVTIFMAVYRTPRQKAHVPLGVCAA